MQKQEVCIAYVPVLHEGYIRFFTEHPGATIVLLTRDSIASLGNEFEYLTKKDMLRAVEDNLMERALGAIFQGRRVCIYEEWADDTDHVAMPDEDVSHAFAWKYLGGSEVRFSSIFLRYDRVRAQQKENALSLARVSLDTRSFETRMLKKAVAEAGKSFDWWRQVGCVLAKDGKALLWAHNQHIPEEQWPNSYGDPRSLFKSGEAIDVSTAQHAESRLIGEAARRGIKTEGADLFITTFPCVPCMEHVGSAGIKRLFFMEGSYGLNSREVLDLYGIEAIHVEM